MTNNGSDNPGEKYGFLSPPTASTPSSQLGTMILSQLSGPLPLVVQFPFPAWATRWAEAGLYPPPWSSRRPGRRARS